MRPEGQTAEPNAAPTPRARARGAVLLCTATLSSGCNAVFGMDGLSYDGAAGSAPSCLVALSDGFEAASVDPSVWIEWGESSTHGVAAGRFLVEPAANADSAWGELKSTDTFDLTGCAVLVEAPTVLNPSGGATTVFVVMTPESTGWSSTAGFRVSGGALHASVVDAGGDALEASAKYDADADRWLRIREQDGSMLLETSADGAAWSALLTTPAVPWIYGVRAQLAAGCVGSASPDPGRAEFDNVNRPP
jgi:hypothetical protein